MWQGVRSFVLYIWRTGDFRDSDQISNMHAQAINTSVPTVRGTLGRRGQPAADPSGQVTTQCGAIATEFSYKPEEEIYDEATAGWSNNWTCRW
jgi:hypothetical protein